MTLVGAQEGYIMAYNGKKACNNSKPHPAHNHRLSFGDRNSNDYYYCAGVAAPPPEEGSAQEEVIKDSSTPGSFPCWGSRSADCWGCGRL